MTVFNFTLTEKSTEKDRFDRLKSTAEGFIAGMLKRKHHACGLKDGSGIIGATFENPGRLEKKFVKTVTALILDFDGKVRRNGELIQEKLDPEYFFPKIPFKGIAHSSFSHTPEFPKFRVILPLEAEISPSEHHRLWCWMNDQLEHKVDPSCKNPDRMFYLPRCTPEAATKGWTWMRETTGPLLSLKAVPENYVASEQFQPLTKSKKQGMHFAEPAYKKGRVDTHELLGFLMDLPIYKWAIDEPEAVSREVWRGLAVNIAAAVLEDENAHNEGLKAFHEISEVDETRYDPGITDKTFADALRSALHPGPMTYASLISNGAPSDVGAGYKAPIAEARALLWRNERENPKVVAPAVQSVSPATGAKFPGTDIFGMTELFRPEGLGDSGDDSDENGEPEKPEVSPADFLFNIETSRWLQRGTKGVWSSEFSGEAMIQILLGKGFPRKAHDPFRARVNKFHAKEHVYNSKELLVDRDGLTIFNTYVPGSIVPVAGQYGDYRDWPDYHEVWWNLADRVEGAYNYLVDWQAAPLQSLVLRFKPYKLGTAPVFVGPQGTGKGTITEMQLLLYGRSNFMSIGQSALDGRFNEELIGKLFVMANEVMSSTNRSAETANKIKPWVTDPEIPIEGKFKELRNVPNDFNIGFTANEEKPVIVERTDRRYSIFTTLRKLDLDVGDRVWKDLQGDRSQLARFFHYLLYIRQVKIKYGVLYQTEARKQLMTANDTSDFRFATTIIEDGWLQIASHWVDSSPMGKMREPVVAGNCVPSDTLYEVYLDFCKMHGVKPYTRTRAFKTLKELLPQATNFRKRVGAYTPTVWGGLPMHSAVTPVTNISDHKKEIEDLGLVTLKDEETNNIDVGAVPPKA